METMTIIINNQTVTAKPADILALLGMAQTVTVNTVPKVSKAKQAEQKMEAKAKRHAASDANRAKHDAVLDSKRVERMTQTAVDKLAEAGFACKPSKQGKWIWLYPADSKGRTPEFIAACEKLPKGWKHSKKRGAAFRDFS